MKGYPGMSRLLRKAIAFQGLGRNRLWSKASVECGVNCFPYIRKMVLVKVDKVLPGYQFLVESFTLTKYGQSILRGGGRHLLWALNLFHRTFREGGRWKQGSKSRTRVAGAATAFQMSDMQTGIGASLSVCMSSIRVPQVCEE
jgi:hypothetical protein